jgi:GcrA cell cycle regulator
MDRRRAALKSRENQMELSNWAPAHSDALRDLVTKGASYAEAAQVINARFHTDYSRSAALGRARRLGLGPESRQQPSLPVKPADARAPAAPDAAQPRPLGLPWPVPPFKGRKRIKLRSVAIEPRHLSLSDLACGDCRYPYGGEEEGEAITFCGHPRRAGSPYCTPHFHLSRDPIAPTDRTSITATLRLAEKL